MIRVKGTKITSKVRFVEELYGDETLEQVLQALSPANRSQLHGVVGIGWYPQRLYDRLVGAIVQVVGRGDVSILDAIGRHTAEVQAAGAYRGLYQAAQPETVLRRMVPMHSQLNDPAEMELLSEGPGRLALIVRQPPSSPTLCRIATSFYVRSLELCGAEQVSVRESSCTGLGDDCCRFEISWDGTSGPTGVDAPG